MRVPLFPLHTIILPGGQLPLRIFEPRYIDMLTSCFRENTGFGVCQIREGHEAGEAATPYLAGTLVRIADWGNGEDGLLNVLTEGEQKFSIQSTEVAPDGLVIGEVTLMPHEANTSLPDEYRELSELLKRVFEQMQWNESLSSPDFDDSLWVGSRLLEILPMPKETRHLLFMCDDPLERLKQIKEIIHESVAKQN